MVAMHPRLPRALLSILAACFVLHHAMTPVATCAPKACGNVRIECPFWLTEDGSQPCGPPAFQVHCRCGRASLARSFRGGYKILRISYADRTVVVANDDVQTDGAGCPVPRIDVTASNSLAPLSASSANRQLVFLFNCTVPQAAGFVNVTGPGTRAVVRLDERYNTTEAKAVAGGCDYAVVPVAGSSTAASAGVEYPRLLREGHLLEWGTSARDCGQTFASVCADGSSRPARCHKDSFMVGETERHYFHGMKMWINYSELFQLVHQKALDKSLVGVYCLMKMYEMKRDGRDRIAFIDPNSINEETWSTKGYKESVEGLLLEFLKRLHTRAEIIFPYNFCYHWILLIIKVSEGKVTLLDSLSTDASKYAIVRGMLDRAWKKFITEVPGEWKQQLKWVQPKGMRQAQGTELCAYYICENIHIITSERSRDARDVWLMEMRDQLLPTDRVRAIQEEIAGFLLDHVIDPKREFHYKKK